MTELRAAVFDRELGRNLGDDAWPTVSVVMPIRNEAAHLEQAVSSVLAQDYPRPFDVCLAVGPSDDGTEAIADRLAASDGRVRVVPNPVGVTPAGLNRAIAATTGEVVVRVDGHSNLSAGYIRRAVETMARTGAVNVGGRQVPEPQTPFEAAVAAATTSLLGTGGATYRIGGVEGPVDTVYLGVFDRAAGDEVGWFDESLIRNQDYELNIRLRQAGGRVWFDPELAVGYRPRGSFRSLARQYDEYGYWKAEVLRHHPSSLRVRQAVPVMLPAMLSLGGVLAMRRRRYLMVPSAYLGALALASRRSGCDDRWRFITVLGVTHLAWGIGFWRNVATGGDPGRRKRRRDRGRPA